MLRVLFFFIFLAFFIIGCARPTTQHPTISLPELQTEITFQLRKEYRTAREREERVGRIATPLLAAGAPLCSETGLYFGFTYFDKKILDPLDSVSRALFLDYYMKNRRRGGSEKPGEYPFVIKVRQGFGAEEGGLLKGDRILEVGGKSVKPFYRMVKEEDALTGKKVRKKKWINTMDQALGSVQPNEKTRFKVRRRIEHEVLLDNHKGTRKTYKDTTLELFFVPERICSNRVFFVKGEAINAYTDGKDIAVTSGMLKFASDEELALVIAHELAHCVEKHIRKKKINSWIGTLTGGIVDAAIGVGLGIPTYNRYSNAGAQIGTVAFSQSFELEADYIGLYILARAGFSTKNAAGFWRRMAEKSPLQSNSMMGTHPPTSQRYLLLRKTHLEIEHKKESGESLMPNRE